MATSAVTVVTAEVTARVSQYGEADETAGSYTQRGRADFLADLRSSQVQDGEREDG